MTVALMRRKKHIGTEREKSNEDTEIISPPSKQPVGKQNPVLINT